MRNILFRNRDKAFLMSTAELVLDQTHSMVRQMVLPLVAQRRVKGALEYVSRESGLPYSKVRKIYYRLTDNILHFEFANIAAAFDRAAIRQERFYREEADRLATLIAERELWEKQHGFNLAMDKGGLEAPSNSSRSGT